MVMPIVWVGVGVIALFIAARDHMVLGAGAQGLDAKKREEDRRRNDYENDFAKLGVNPVPGDNVNGHPYQGAYHNYLNRQEVRKVQNPSNDGVERLQAKQREEQEKQMRQLKKQTSATDPITGQDYDNRRAREDINRMARQNRFK